MRCTLAPVLLASVMLMAVAVDSKNCPSNDDTCDSGDDAESFLQVEQSIKSVDTTPKAADAQDQAPPSTTQYDTTQSKILDEGRAGGLAQALEGRRLSQTSPTTPTTITDAVFGKKGGMQRIENTKWGENPCGAAAEEWPDDFNADVLLQYKNFYNGHGGRRGCAGNLLWHPYREGMFVTFAEVPLYHYYGPSTWTTSWRHTKMNVRKLGVTTIHGQGVVTHVNDNTNRRRRTDEHSYSYKNAEVLFDHPYVKSEQDNNIIEFQFLSMESGGLEEGNRLEFPIPDGQFWGSGDMSKCVVVKLDSFTYYSDYVEYSGITFQAVNCHCCEG